MTQKPVTRLEKVFLIALWLFGCFWIWSPWTGATISACEVGNEMTEYRYGAIGYYSVRFEEYQHVASQFELTGLVATIASTLLLTFICHRLWHYGRLIR